MRKVTMAARWAVNRSAGIGLSMGLLLVLGAVSTHAEVSQDAKQKAAPAAVPAGTAAGPVEGLRVHGHWTIEVRNPDGKLVNRQEFENALSIGGGDTHLVNVLGRTRTAGTWQVRAIGNVNQICESSPGVPSDCFIVESTDSLPAGGNIFKTLTATVSGSTLVLNGSVIAQRNGDVNVVTTGDNHCSNSVSPASCSGGSALNTSAFTGTVLATPIPVQNGQQVQVRVVISFS